MGTPAIQAIVFQPNGGYDITYAEERDFSDNGMIIRQGMFPAGFEQEQEEVKEAIRDLLDLALGKMQDSVTRRAVR
jgi:hypothetical protein